LQTGSRKQHITRGHYVLNGICPYISASLIRR
jgi:hypothetical protein